MDICLTLVGEVDGEGVILVGKGGFTGNAKLKVGFMVNAKLIGRELILVGKGDLILINDLP